MKKILIVALDNLGDTVMASAVLNPLKRFEPHSKIGIWVKSYVADLFVDHSLVDVIHASDPFWDKAPGQERGKFKAFTAVLNDVRKEAYDTVFVLNSEWRRALACRVAGIPERVGFQRRKSGSFLTLAVPPPLPDQHFVDDHRQLIEIWAGRGVALEDCVPRLEITDEENTWWKLWSVQRELVERNYVLIHLFSGDEDKNWPLTCWLELIERRITTDPRRRFVVVCGPSEEARLGVFRARLERPEVVLMVAPTLHQLKAVIGRAELVLSGDTGPGHVAAALGVPVLSLFGNTNPMRSRPMGRSSIHVVQHRPLRHLPVDEVLKEMEKFFAST